MQTLYNIELKIPGGSVAATGSNKQDVARYVVSCAIKHGSKPRLKWWQYWRDKWEPICVTEYLKQTGEKK